MGYKKLEIENEIEQILDTVEDIIRALNNNVTAIHVQVQNVELEAGQYLLQAPSAVVTDLVIQDYKNRITKEFEIINGIEETTDEIREAVITLHTALRKV